MTIRDGRNVVHDLGPRQLFGTIVSILACDPSFRPMPSGASWRDETSQNWIRGARKPPAIRKPTDHAAARIVNLDRVREQDRIRQQRRRDRQKASTAA